MKKLFARLGLLACISGSLLAAPAASAGQPPLHIVVGFPPGGALDALARIVANDLSKQLNEPVIVDNKPGAGGTIATSYVAHSSPTDNTLLFADTSMLIAPHIYKQVTYNWSRDFSPVAMLGAADFVIAVPLSSPAHTLADYIKMAKAKPGFYTYGSSGVGSIHHLSGELLQMKTGIKLVHVPYRGGSPSLQGVTAGDVSMAIVSLGASASFIKNHKIRALALLSDHKYAGYDIPPIDSYIPGYNVSSAVFLLAPKGFDAQRIQRISSVLGKAMQSPKVIEAFTLQGSKVSYKDSADLGAWMGKEEQKWAEVIKHNKISVEH
jgi:tripartite-type tricarboxylate transporter receptor subunit TctC